MANLGCIACNSQAHVTRTDDDFKCSRCGHTWTVEDEQANAVYIRTTQGRAPAEPMAKAETLEGALKQAVNGNGDSETVQPVEETGTVEEAAAATEAAEEEQADAESEPENEETAPAADDKSEDDAKPTAKKSGGTSRSRKTSRSK